ncbi:PIN domain-containing protein [Agrobacterium tumefaciens]|uniref:PIN domain-containing protein n=1 Tax=Agrobacterium tumefaciens TaxID=358 RepID=UPI003BA044AD
MTGQNDHKPGGKNPVNSAKDQPTANEGEPMFLLEDLYPEAAKLFSASVAPPADQSDAIVVFDTNALLLPYQIGKSDLTALSEVLKELAAADRLFVPGRVAREFIKNRDRKLAEMIKALKDRSSRFQLPDRKLSPLLDGMKGYEEVALAAEAIDNSWKVYKKAQERIISQMQEWRGNDPVSVVYDAVLGDGRIVEVNGERDALRDEWALRRVNKTPPGYKDAGKDDTGIGDFLIWKTILQLGQNHQKHLIFITGEEKADWFVRSDNARIYPRPELIDEYRRASGGKSIRLSTLGELLEEMKAPEDVVIEVKSVELQANNAVQMATSDPSVTIRVRQRTSGTRVMAFDYSTSDGRTTITQGDVSVDLRFGKASKERINFYRDGSTTRIARVKDAEVGAVLSIDDFDTSSRSYSIAIGEVFLAETNKGDTLVGRITGIMDDTRGDDRDLVEFLYVVYPRGMTTIAP